MATIVRRLPPLQEQAYHALRKAILKGQLVPGQRLTEVEVAKRFGISRNPVREAMRRLQQDGLIEFPERGSGAYVSSTSDEEFDDLSRLRAAIEGVAARLAAKRMSDEEIEDLERRRRQFTSFVKAGRVADAVEADYDFHRGIYLGSHSPRIGLVLDSLHAQITHFRKLTLSIPRRADGASRGHAEIFEAVKAHDAALAERLMREHIDEARRAFGRYMTELNDKKRRKGTVA